MAFLVDTNTCCYAMRGELGVAKRFAALAAADVFVSAITLAEAWTGARKSRRRKRIEQQWAYFLAPFRDRILHFDEAAADRYADVRAHLELEGRMIGDRDCMLAGIALANGLAVVRAWKQIARERLEPLYTESDLLTYARRNLSA